MIVSTIRGRIIRWTKSGPLSKVSRTLVYRRYCCPEIFIS